MGRRNSQFKRGRKSRHNSFIHGTTAKFALAGILTTAVINSEPLFDNDYKGSVADTADSTRSSFGVSGLSRIYNSWKAQDQRMKAQFRTGQVNPPVQYASASITPLGQNIDNAMAQAESLAGGYKTVRKTEETKAVSETTSTAKPSKSEGPTIVYKKGESFYVPTRPVSYAEMRRMVEGDTTSFVLPDVDFSLEIAKVRSVESSVVTEEETDLYVDSIMYAKALEREARNTPINLFVEQAHAEDPIETVFAYSNSLSAIDRKSRPTVLDIDFSQFLLGDLFASIDTFEVSKRPIEESTPSYNGIDVASASNSFMNNITGPSYVSFDAASIPPQAAAVLSELGLNADVVNADVPSTSSSSYHTYKVRDGDKIWSIIERTFPGLTDAQILDKVNDTISRNGLRSDGLIHKGDKITIDMSMPPAKGATTYASTSLPSEDIKWTKVDLPRGLTLSDALFNHLYSLGNRNVARNVYGGALEQAARDNGYNDIKEAGNIRAGTTLRFRSSYETTATAGQDQKIPEVSSLNYKEISDAAGLAFYNAPRNGIDAYTHTAQVIEKKYGLKVAREDIDRFIRMPTIEGKSVVFA